MPRNQEIFCQLFKDKGIQVFVKRLDRVGENISGNKWYKLLPNIEEALAQRKEAVITFGGAFSNHIFATAAAGKKFNISTIGYIRGEAQLELNPTLKFAQECGMDIRYLSRMDYRKKEDENFLQKLLKKEENYFLIPEGGSNDFGINGCRGILEDEDFDFAMMACGTGGSFSGMVGGNSQTVCLGIPVLKGAGFLFETIKQNLDDIFQSKQKNWDLLLEYHFGGYGKIKPELLNFIQQFFEDHQILLEPIYTGKMMYALFDLIKKNHFPKGQKSSPSIREESKDGMESKIVLRSVDQANNMNLNYKTFGSGDPIIILHGLFGSLDNWQTIAKQLAETHSVYLVDQRNHGKSPHDDEHSYELMAEDLRVFMESQWIYEATIIGHSMGGKTAMQFAFDNPDMVEKLVVVDITAEGSKGEHEAIFDAFFSLDLNKLTSRKEAQAFFESKLDQADVVQFLLKNLARKKEGGFAWKMNLSVLHETYTQIMGSLALEGQFEAPALFVRGAKSDYVSDQGFVQLQQKFTDARLVTVADAGHWIHAEQPKEFLKELMIFLNN